jgi:hypothetical protein
MKGLESHRRPALDGRGDAKKYILLLENTLNHVYLYSENQMSRKDHSTSTGSLKKN